MIVEPHISICGVEENECLYEVAQNNLNLCYWAGVSSMINFDQYNLTKLPYETNTVDVVFSFASLHLWKDPIKVFKECKRICKKNGSIIIVDTNRYANEGQISFVLQTMQNGAEGFMSSLKASYNKEEIIALFEKGELQGWTVEQEDLNLIISSQGV